MAAGISPEDQAVFDRLTASLRAEAAATPAGSPPPTQLAGITHAVDARSWRWVSFMAHGGGTLLIVIALLTGMLAGAGIGYWVAESNSSASKPHTSGLGRALAGTPGSGGGPNGVGSGAALAPGVPGVPSTSTTATTTRPATPATTPAAGAGPTRNPATGLSPSTAPGSVGPPLLVTTTVVPPGATAPTGYHTAGHGVADNHGAAPDHHDRAADHHHDSRLSESTAASTSSPTAVRSALGAQQDFAHRRAWLSPATWPILRRV
jgi:hypothetical protein